MGGGEDGGLFDSVYMPEVAWSLIIRSSNGDEAPEFCVFGSSGKLALKRRA